VKIEPMTPGGFTERSTWRYDTPYDFYDESDEPVRNPERFFAVRDDDGRLAGFYYFEPNGDVLEYGLGLRPDLTGRGLGLEFFRTGLEFGRDRYRPRLVRLYVAAFNERAVKVYERAGFRATGRHTRTFERWGDVPFVTMDEQR
jgi:ribosomal-protein-alanine N-acetyltransferase